MVLPPSRLVFYETQCTEISQAALVEFKDWAIIYCTLSIIPILWPAVIFGEQIGLDLGWIYLFTGVLVASTVVPVALSLIWERNTAMGVSFLFP